ncbi:Aminopeptidase RNPEPL1 [Varanus komodoensis]|nr:Aminopeptidase RNPEPL1 [Varanus komodoensis]
MLEVFKIMHGVEKVEGDIFLPLLLKASATGRYKNETEKETQDLDSSQETGSAPALAARGSALATPGSGSTARRPSRAGRAPPGGRARPPPRPARRRLLSGAAQRPLPPPPVPTFPERAPPAAAPCPLLFRVDPFTDYGSALTISLPASLEPHQPFQVIIRYITVDAPAIWWLDPELTYGNSKPFVFTQGHSVCNRSFFPCFDTPAVKFTYSAIVKAPAGMQVLMSATQSTYEEQEGVYQFYMEYPIPAYLVALVAGDLVPADIGPRSKVWAEPCLLPTAIEKLSGRVERWLSAAERLYGPYMWGRYDIVFLPPSFPIVAMENPCLTFIISSILESEEFLIIDVIHEVAHSWFGNAVTNATWEEMWLSEGLATYAQRRITTETYGELQPVPEGGRCVPDLRCRGQCDVVVRGRDWDSGDPGSSPRSAVVPSGGLWASCTPSAQPTSQGCCCGDKMMEEM